MTTTSTLAEGVDVVDELVGLRPGDALDALRRRRPVTREQLQASYDALFTPVDDSDFPLAERLLVAAFATRLTADDSTAQFYADAARRADPERTAIAVAEASAAATAGPFGRYTEAGLRDESTDGRRYEPSIVAHDALGERLTAALAHAHLLTSHPREADAAAQTRLLDAGWSIDGIVTLSQLVSFLAFQQRVVSGLRVLAPSLPVAEHPALVAEHPALVAEHPALVAEHPALVAEHPALVAEPVEAPATQEVSA